MAQFERYGTRDLSYSHWHRHLSRRCTYMDIDGAEYCYKCKQTLLLVEEKMDTGQSVFDTFVLYRLAKRANIPAVLILYTVGDEMICDCGQSARQVTGLRVRHLWPERSELDAVTLQEWGQEIERIHANHICN